MKITVDIDCTPDEARQFLGLPDVKPMQDAMMREIQDRLRTNLQAMDPDTMVKTWLPAGIQGGIQGMEQMQKMFWSQMTSALGQEGRK